MTVTKGKRNYSFPVQSANNSDAESVHLPSASASDTESLNNEPIAQRRPFLPPTVKNLRTEEVNLKKNSGRKKLRRYQNRCLLQTLAEEEENEGPIVVIMESYESPFTKLLQDDDALEFWNAFIEKSEEEQAQVIAAFSQHSRTKDTKNVQKEKPFSRISPKIKRTIKIKKNLSLGQVKEFENDLITFFKATPNQIYIKCPNTYFERLLLHAIAQYHGLQSLGMVENGNKRVEIYNTFEDWIPAECFLTDFVAQLRK